MSSFEERLRASLSPAYEIERELTGGGMSRVFVATDRMLGRRIVIKVLPPELSAGVNRERFRREIQVAAQLQHPHIVTLLSAGEDGDVVYYTMPFIEGESLRVALEKKGALAVREVVRILHDVVDALAYAHARGVVHRDIKPGNILTLGAHALVTDFGVAKALNAAMPASGITTAGMVIGTPAYMAPEQLAGDPASDHRIDIYAVGLLAYELLTGESPFTGPSPQATMAAQLTRDPEPIYKSRPEVPPALSDIIMQCLAKTPEERPQSAEALMSALDEITTSSGEVKTPAAGALSAVDARRRRLGRIAAVGAVVLGSGVALFASQRGAGRVALPPSPDSARASTAAPAVTAANTVTRTSVMAAPPPPVSLTRADSMAIAEAVRKRLAQEEATRGPSQAMLMADSLSAHVRGVVIDSIVKANLHALGPRWVESAVSSSDMFSRRRVVITEPRESRDPALNSIGRAIVDSLRRSLSRRGGYMLVDQDSVRATLAQSRNASVLAKTLKPDLVISPTFVGTGDSVTLMVTTRDVTGATPGGIRIATTNLRRDDPSQPLSSTVQRVLRQLEDIRHAPRFVPGPRPASLPRAKVER